MKISPVVRLLPYLFPALIGLTLLACPLSTTQSPSVNADASIATDAGDSDNEPALDAAPGSCAGGVDPITDKEVLDAVSQLSGNWQSVYLREDCPNGRNLVIGPEGTSGGPAHGTVNWACKLAEDGYIEFHINDFCPNSTPQYMCSQFYLQIKPKLISYTAHFPPAKNDYTYSYNWSIVGSKLLWSDNEYTRSSPVACTP